MGEDHQGKLTASERDDVLREVVGLGEAERWEEAIALLAQLERTFSEDPAVLCMLGVAAREVGTDGQAYEYFRRCLAQEPADPTLLVTAGTGLAALDDPDAERVLRLAALAAPEFAPARVAYGAYLGREGMFELAVEELRAARDLDPESLPVRRELAVAFLRAGQTNQALAELEDALAGEAADSEVRFLYGLALLEKGRHGEGAEEVLRAAAELIAEFDVQLTAALASAAEGWMEAAWDSLARAELAPAAEAPLLREAEDVIASGAAAARRFLRSELLPSVLHNRLLSRP